MNKTHDVITEWVDTLSDRLTDIRFWDVEEIKTALKVHLAIAMKECLTIQISETRRKINQMKVLIAGCGGQNQNRYQGELIKLKEIAKEELDALNQANAIVRKDEKFRILALFVAQRFGGEVLEELKCEVKKEMGIVLENKEGQSTDNAFQRATKETREEFKTKLEAAGMTDAIKLLDL